MQPFPSNAILRAVSIASFCGSLAIVWVFDSKLAMFLAVLLVTVGGVLPLGFVTQRRER